jgi:hypothetical protein
MDEAVAPGACWQPIDRFAELRSRWVTLIGEHLRDERGQALEYWRVERASSVIVLPLHRGALLLPPPVFRPGVGRATLDFPGGRLPDGGDPAAAAPAVLARELGVAADAVESLQRLSPIDGWDVDSSFSNQRLHGCATKPRCLRRVSTCASIPVMQASRRCSGGCAACSAWRCFRPGAAPPAEGGGAAEGEPARQSCLMATVFSTEKP